MVAQAGMEADAVGAAVGEAVLAGVAVPAAGGAALAGVRAIGGVPAGAGGRGLSCRDRTIMHPARITMRRRRIIRRARAAMDSPAQRPSPTSLRSNSRQSVAA